MYQFYLDDVLFPVAPGSMTIKIKNQNDTLNLINDGEINLLKTPGLSDISFKLLLPNTRYPFAQYTNGFQPAVYFLSLLEKLKAERRTAQFVVIRTTGNGQKLDWDTNLQVSLEEYEIEEDADNGFDMHVDIKLKQYRAYATKVITIKKADSTATQQTQRPADKQACTSYTIKSGDTLWGIARRELGDGAKWKTIYTANRQVIDDTARKRGMASGGQWIFPGTVLQIPR